MLSPRLESPEAATPPSDFLLVSGDFGAGKIVSWERNLRAASALNGGASMLMLVSVYDRHRIAIYPSFRPLEYVSAF